MQQGPEYERSKSNKKNTINIEHWIDSSWMPPLPWSWSTLWIMEQIMRSWQSLSSLIWTMENYYLPDGLFMSFKWDNVLLYLLECLAVKRSYHGYDYNYFHSTTTTTTTSTTTGPASPYHPQMHHLLASSGETNGIACWVTLLWPLRLQIRW